MCVYVCVPGGGGGGESVGVWRQGAEEENKIKMKPTATCNPPLSDLDVAGYYIGERVADGRLPRASVASPPFFFFFFPSQKASKRPRKGDRISKAGGVADIGDPVGSPQERYPDGYAHPGSLRIVQRGGKKSTREE